MCSGGNRPLGQACATHQECQSARCDNRPGAGCVPQDGSGEANQFCTTHQQCHSGFCTIAGGKISGRCSAYDRPLGAACSAHGECSSRRCDNRPGAGCVPPNGAGGIAEFCTSHEQCQSDNYCKIINGLRGECTSKVNYGSSRGQFQGSASSESSSSRPPTASPDPSAQSKCAPGQVLCGTTCISSGAVCCYQGAANAYPCSSGAHCCYNRCCCSNTGSGMACF